MASSQSLNCLGNHDTRSISVDRRWMCSLAGALCLVFLLGCSRQPLKEQVGAVSFERVSAGEIPLFADDMDHQSLRIAIAKSLAFYDRIPGDRIFLLGEMQVRADVLKTSLAHFLKLLDANQLSRETISREFDVYLSRSGRSTDQALVTGYFEPVLEGRIEPDSRFRYPLYGVPPDLLTIDLAAFDPERFSGDRLVGRLKDNRVVPYYSRAEIDGQAKLAQMGGQLAWLQDPIDAFFLHVQGSGMLRMPDGRFLRVGYAGSNGRPYRSMGKYLVEKGLMSLDEVTLQSIRDYLRAHPEIRDEAMWHNESYVFFRWVDEGPVGSLNVLLTPGRSIATDARYHPRGALAFLETEKPRLDAMGQVIGREPLRRWVLNQDTGGAIKGIGRVDLFCGSGEAAEEIAGRLKYPGKLYFLVKKE